MQLPEHIPTPVFVLDAARLRANLETAKRVREEAGCKILLATKAFSLPAAFPMMTDYLDGTTASGEHEAIMGHESFGKEDQRAEGLIRLLRINCDLTLSID